jgi:hypothetical protein
MKDKSLLGDKPFKKVIPQDVEAVYPQAVGKVVKSIPDVMQTATAKQISKGEFQLLLLKADNLKAGDVVEILNKDRTPEVARIKSAEGNAIDVALNYVGDGEKVFVHGHEVNDFGTVDYDALSMLNVSATQELAKQIKTLRQDNSDLQNEAKRLTAIERQQDKKIASLEASNERLTAMAAKMEALEKKVATMQAKEHGGVRTVALSQRCEAHHKCRREFKKY